MKDKRRQKRGYHVAVLVGFDEQAIHIWYVFSESVKKVKTISLSRKWKNADDRDKVQFYEKIINEFRSSINQGLKSILLASPPNSSLSHNFLEYIKKHHRWLIDSRGDSQVSYGILTGNARNLEETWHLLQQEENKEIIKRTTAQEAYLLMKQLEKSINLDQVNYRVVYGLNEIEEIILKGGKKDKKVANKLDYLLMTDELLENSKQNNRLYRLKQIAENKGIITKIISNESLAGIRINEFGGIICFKKH